MNTLRFRLRRAVVAALIALGLMSCAALEAAAVPDAKLVSPHWLANDPASTLSVDHQPWSQFLAAYLVIGGDGVNRFAYATVDAAGRARLVRYVASLEATPVSRLARAEQLAFWIDLYNALTTRVVLEHYPVASIRDIGGFLSFGPWGEKRVTVEGERLSLDDIEHGILRPIWRDPRIHYALNCAAVGCPKLQAVAFTAANADALLDAAARDYVNNPRGVRIAGDRLVVSSLYRWYRSDFGDVMAHLRRYAAPGLAQELERFRAPDDDAYDWRLIDVRP